jgi:ribosomal-protein-alanine N-acetyltransferase
VARIDGRLVGYSGVMYHDEEAHVTNIAVDPAAHRRGVGTRILADQARAARAHGSTAMSLEVRHTNVAAQELYRRFGFVPAGIRRRYYENTDDAIVMWCHELAGPDYERRLRALEAGEPEPDHEEGS